MQNVPRRSLSKAMAAPATKPTWRGVSLERDVHGNTAGLTLWGMMEIKFIPSTRRVLSAWQRQDCGKERGRCQQSWTGSASTPRSPFPSLRLLDSSQGLQWSPWLVERAGGGLWAWQAALGETQGLDPGRAGRSGRHRERIYLHQESVGSGSGNRNHLHAGKRNLLPHDKATGSLLC